MPSHNINMNFI